MKTETRNAAVKTRWTKEKSCSAQCAEQGTFSAMSLKKFEKFN
jgi:hypothetical protein